MLNINYTPKIVEILYLKQMPQLLVARTAIFMLRSETFQTTLVYYNQHLEKFYQQNSLHLCTSVVLVHILELMMQILCENPLY